MTEINFERSKKEFQQRLAERKAQHQQSLFEAFVASVQQDLYPRQRRSPVQTATVTMVRWAVAQLNLWLDHLSDAEVDDEPVDTVFVDGIYTVVEPETPIAASFFQRKAAPYGSTHAQKQQERPRAATARPYPQTGRDRGYRSPDDADNTRDEQVSSGDSRTDGGDAT